VRPGKDACGLEHADDESKQPRRDEADSDRSQRAHRHEGWNAEDDDKTHDSEPAFGGMPRAVILRMQQQLDGVRSVTSGTVMVETTIDEPKAETENDDLWHLASRLLGVAQAAAVSSSDPAAITQVQHARMTIKIVEDTERKKIEKYLSLDIPLLRSMLPVTRKNDTSVFSPSGQQATGTALFEDLKPMLVESLRHDEELFAFLNDHPGVSGVDLVLLIEDRIAALVPDYSPRVLASLIAKIGLHEFVGPQTYADPERASPSTQ